MELQPGVVETNMTKATRTAKGAWDRISTEKFVRNSLAFVPSGGITSASWNHQVLAGIILSLPDGVFRRKMQKRMQIKKERLEKEKAQ